MCSGKTNIYILIKDIHRQGLQEKFCKAEQDCFLGPRGQPDTSLKIEDLRSNNTTM